MDHKEHLDRVVALINLAPALAEAAQDALDDHDWDEGGACDDIARAMGDVLAEHGYEFRDGGWDGDDHAWLVVELEYSDYMVDINHAVYETGGGYSWEPISDAEIMPQDVLIAPTN